MSTSGHSQKPPSADEMFGQAEAAAFNQTSRNASQNGTIELAVQRAALSAYSPEGRKA